MCYRCATNPFIHCHCCIITMLSSSLLHCGHVIVTLQPCHCRIAAMSLSHCGHVIAAVMWWWCLCHCGVAFTVALSQFHHHNGIVVSPSLSVAVLSLPLRCHLRHCIIVVLLLLWCCLRCCIVAVLSSPSPCCLCISHSFVVAIMVSPSSLHRHSVVVAVALLWCLRCCIVVVSSLLSWCRLHHCIVAVFITISSSLSWCCLHRCIVAVSSWQFCWNHHGVAFAVAFAVTSSQFHRCLMVSSLQSQSLQLSSCHPCHRHCVVAIALLLLLLLSRKGF